MRARRDNLKGIIVVNKPQGITSFGVVKILRRKLKIRRIGHGGTLDPLATGVLVILAGKATKKFQEIISYPKEYIAQIKLGENTSTGDAQGKVIESFPQEKLDSVRREDIEEALKNFQGEVYQVPPMVSALRYKGKRLYSLARKNIEVERKPRKVFIYEIKLLEYHPPYFKLYIKCSRGTYVRKIAQDLGEVLGCGAHITQISRISVGPYHIEDALSLDEVDESKIIPL